MGLKLEGHLGDTPIVIPVRVQVNWRGFPMGLVATALVVGVIQGSKSTTRDRQLLQKQADGPVLLGMSPAKLLGAPGEFGGQSGHFLGYTPMTATGLVVGPHPKCQRRGLQLVRNALDGLAPLTVGSGGSN